MLSVQQLVAKLNPSSTVLFFGAGSSIPSGGLSGIQLSEAISKEFGIDGAKFSLTENAQIAVNRVGRKKLIEFLRSRVANLKPSTGIKNLPLYPWASLYTTNYDRVIELSYQESNMTLRKISSNFDFGSGRDDDSTRLFKVHGTIEKDVSDGNHDRIIITEEDYDLTEDYREMIWDRLRVDLSEHDCIIIGHSLEDDHVKKLVAKISKLKRTANHGTAIYVLSFAVDPDRAALFEGRGIQVAFGGIDDFFDAMAKAGQPSLPIDGGDRIFKGLHSIIPSTVVVEEAKGHPTTLDRMYNGWPASWADVAAGFTFPRNHAQSLAEDVRSEGLLIGVFLGASGTGKTTGARQAVLDLMEDGYIAWEHNVDRELLSDDWIQVARRLKGEERRAVLFIDDAHDHLREINRLVDQLVREGIEQLVLLLASPRHDWNPRVKSPNLFKRGKSYLFGNLSDQEIDGLIKLVDENPSVARLVERNFGGFSRSEKRRRIRSSFSRNTFVCLKYIFANEAFDDIILREFAGLDMPLQDIYRTVAALESLNVKVHRQLVLRIIGLQSDQIPNVLDRLTDIVEEYDVDRKDGIYGWRGRHKVIAEIVTAHKFHDTGSIYKLLERVIENLSMTYNIEIRTVRNLCSPTGGLRRAGTTEQQNNLLRQMISHAPGERVARHRLIANLISSNHISQAETEIRLFGNDFREDGPVARYRVKILVKRALKTKGILDEDRMAIITQAKTLAEKNLKRFPDNKYILSSYCEVGLAVLKLQGSYDVFDVAMETLRKAEATLGDPEIGRMVERFGRAIQGIEREQVELDDVIDLDD